MSAIGGCLKIIERPHVGESERAALERNAGWPLSKRQRRKAATECASQQPLLYVQADARATCRSLADAGSASFASGMAPRCGTTSLSPLYPALPVLAFSARGRMPIRAPVSIVLGLLERDQTRRRTAVSQTSRHFIPSGRPSTVRQCLTRLPRRRSSLRIIKQDQPALHRQHT